jgi:CTP:molybdopterin cytidylyltransferase MocA
MAPIAVVPAAGKSERFGSQKLIAIVDGERMIDRTIRSLIEGGAATVIVVSGSEGLVPGSLTNPDPERGMFSTIQVGIAAAQGDPILLLPGDMPFVRPATVRAVIDAYRDGGGIVLPAFNGKHGHPIAIPAALRAEIVAAPPGSNLAAILKTHPRRELHVHDPGVLRDVDVADDLH